jgi:hypothetical protein
MTSTYDAKAEVWVVTEGNVTVRGKSKSGCEERVREMVSRLQEPKPEKTLNERP